MIGPSVPSHIQVKRQDAETPGVTDTLELHALNSGRVDAAGAGTLAPLHTECLSAGCTHPATAHSCALMEAPASAVCAFSHIVKQNSGDLRMIL